MKKIDASLMSSLCEGLVGYAAYESRAGLGAAMSEVVFYMPVLRIAKQKYDHEIIGEAIFPNGFGCINLPGPSFGFGTIVLKDNEDDGKVKISILKKRKDYDGKNVASAELKSSLSEYFDGFFIFS